MKFDLGILATQPVPEIVKQVQLAESLGAMQIQLTPEDVRRIAEALPPAAVAGTRYDEHQMRALDSERA